MIWLYSANLPVKVLWINTPYAYVQRNFMFSFLLYLTEIWVPGTHAYANWISPLHLYLFKIIKFKRFLGFFLRWVTPIKFMTSQCLLTNQNPLNRHPTCLCFDNKYFSLSHWFRRLAAYAGLVFNQKFLHWSTSLVY